MPAGLLLSLTARPVRTGPGMGPSRRRCRRPQVPLPHWQERPAARLGELSWELSPFPSRAVHCGTATARFPLIPARGAFLPRHPRQGGWGKGTATGHPIPPRSRYGFPPLPGETRTLPCPLSREYRSRRLPATCSSLSQPHTPFCFPLPGPSSHQYVRPAPSRPEDCALNQHFSSHPGTFVQRKMIL